MRIRERISPLFPAPFVSNTCVVAGCYKKTKDELQITYRIIRLDLLKHFGIQMILA